VQSPFHCRILSHCTPLFTIILLYRTRRRWRENDMIEIRIAYRKISIRGHSRFPNCFRLVTTVNTVVARSKVYRVNKAYTKYSGPGSLNIIPRSRRVALVFMYRDHRQYYNIYLFCDYNKEQLMILVIW